MKDYTPERLAALFSRVETLERTIEVAGAFLEYDRDDKDLLAIQAQLALATLKASLQQGFREALLCARETSDEQLEHWLGSKRARAHQ